NRDMAPKPARDLAGVVGIVEHRAYDVGGHVLLEFAARAGALDSFGRELKKEGAEARRGEAHQREYRREIKIQSVVRYLGGDQRQSPSACGQCETSSRRQTRKTKQEHKKCRRPDSGEGQRIRCLPQKGGIEERAQGVEMQFGS